MFRVQRASGSSGFRVQSQEGSGLRVLRFGVSSVFCVLRVIRLVVVVALIEGLVF